MTGQHPYGGLLDEFQDLVARLCATGDDVEIGHTLRTMQSVIEAELGVCKTVLRQRAESHNDGNTAGVTLPGRYRSASVTFPRTTYRLRQGVDREALRAALNPHFDALFKTSCKPRKTLADRVHLLNDEQRALLFEALDENENSAQVSFSGG